MDEYQGLAHTRWECKYHVVFIPKCRRKTLYGGLRPLRRLAEQKESRIEEGHLMIDHVHMMISIPPKYSVARWGRWWDISKERVRFIWLACTESESGILSVNTFGREDTSCPLWDAMNV